MTTGRALSLTLLPLFLFMACSCGKKGEETPKATVQGKVTLDNVPLEKGQIMFAPSKSGTTESAAGEIKDGHFSVVVPVGSKIVQISAQKVTGKRKKYKDDPNSPEVDETVELIPQQYNKKSKLTAEVTAGNNDLPTFELKSK